MRAPVPLVVLVTALAAAVLAASQMAVPPAPPPAASPPRGPLPPGRTGAAHTAGSAEAAGGRASGSSPVGVYGTGPARAAGIRRAPVEEGASAGAGAAREDPPGARGGRLPVTDSDADAASGLPGPGGTSGGAGTDPDAGEDRFRARLPGGAGRTAAGAPGGGARAWPVPVAPRIVRGWQPPATDYGPGHRGVDLAAVPGTRVRAVAAGRVSFAGRVAGRGTVTVELAASGSPPLRTTYQPVRATVAVGTVVRAGQVVGVLEPGTHCPESCLHWGLRRGDRYLDPLVLLPPGLFPRGPSRLLPLHGHAPPRRRPR